MKGSILALFLRALTLPLGLVSIWIVSGFLGKDLYGDFSLLTSWLPIAAVFLVGAPETIAGFINRHPGSAAINAKWTMAAWLLASRTSFVGLVIVLLILGVSAALGYLNTTIAMGSGLAFLVYFLTQPLSVLSTEMFRAGNTSEIAAWGFALAVVNVILLLIGVTLSQGYSDALKIFIAIAAVTIAVLFVRLAQALIYCQMGLRHLYTTLARRWRPGGNRGERTLVAHGMPFALLALISFGIFNLDRTILAIFMPKSVLAEYDVLSRVAMALFSVLSVLSFSMWGTSIGENVKSAWRKTLHLVSLYALAWSTFVLGMFLYADDLLHLLWPSSSAQTSSLTVALIAALFFMRNVTDVFSYTLYSLRKQAVVLRSACIHGPVHVAFAFSMCFFAGVDGMLAGQIIAMGVTSTFILYRAVRHEIRLGK